MKQNVFKTILPAFIAVILLAACEKPPKGDEATIAETEQKATPTGQTYVVDTANSFVRFTGWGVGKNHPGRFKLSYGATAVNKDTVSGGSFVIDIKSMRMEQRGKDIETKLRPHLMSGDFFDADKFGTATFEITNVVPYDPDKDTKKSLVEGANFMVSGNLTLKGEAKNITFPARIDLDGNKLKANANFEIDRTQWKMNYGNDKTLGDKFISETVNVELSLVALKAEGATDSPSAKAETDDEDE
ncbi:MAG TPA: YceI family protein [Chryseosolibacter sp.]|nr:YceI family protein [Chryseosolibacter sp.]